MLPPAHIAGGYLVTRLFFVMAKPEVTGAEEKLLLGIGMFFGVAPDLDMFWAFVRTKSMKFGNVDHRAFCTHAPITWLLPSLLYIILASSPFHENAGIVALIGALSHFILDSVQYGIMWMWPVSRTFYALKDAGAPLLVVPQNFEGLGFWVAFLKAYCSAQYRLTLCCECGIIALGVLFYFW